MEENTDTTNDDKKMSETVKVIVRCRPMSEKEKAAGYHSVVKLHPADGLIELHHKKTTPKLFTFDAVYDCGIQTEIYDEVFRPLVDSVINGFNGTIFAYGQTSAGKTYTMEGVIGDPEREGIIPNSFKHIFSHIARCENNTEFLVSASYLEIYQENVRDLLSSDPKKKLEVRERNDTGVFVKDLTVTVCKTVEDLQKILKDGKRNRIIGKPSMIPRGSRTTNMNVHSSRSHAIFIITIESCESDNEGQEHVKIGKLNLVDLAGSEKQGKTGAVGARMKESIKINLSLSALGNVISALVDGKSTHVPYRDSKLTRLLQDSLGGNAKTIMIANISPASYNYDETLTTLRYANRAKNIQNQPVVNSIDPKDAILLKYKEEIARLKAELALKEAKKKKKKEKTEGEGEVIETDGVEIVRKMEQLLIEERTAYLNEQNLMSEEKEKILRDIKLKDEELRLENEAKEKIKRELEELQAKLLCGGKNIIDVTNENQRKLEKQRQELAEKKNTEREIRKKLLEEETLAMEKIETFESLAEEVAIKTKKLKKLFQRLQSLKEDINEEQEINSCERREKEQTIEALTRDIKLSGLVIDNFVNPDDRARFLQNVEYDEDENAWVIFPSNSNYPHYNVAEKPLSANHHRRPTTNHALKMARLTSKPRYKSENIAVVELSMPPKRTSDLEPQSIVDPYIKEAVAEIVADDVISVYALRRWGSDGALRSGRRSGVGAVRRRQRSGDGAPRRRQRSRDGAPRRRQRSRTPSTQKPKCEYPVPRGLVPKSKSSKRKPDIL